MNSAEFGTNVSTLLIKVSFLLKSFVNSIKLAMIVFHWQNSHLLNKGIIGTGVGLTRRRQHNKTSGHVLNSE